MHVERHQARIYGYHRALCVWSWRHRGCQENPGLVFGLDHGGSCHGMAFRVPAAEKHEVVDYLYQREMTGSAYLARLVPLEVKGHNLEALTFVVSRKSEQYAGKLADHEMLEIIQHAEGKSGANHQYVVSTARQLSRLDIHDHQVNRIAKKLIAIL